MVDESVIKSIEKYLHELLILGIPIDYGVLFGSYARNQSVHPWSDIDLLVISPRYDKSHTRADINLLWRTAARVDSRIEPIAVGVERWQSDDGSTILEVARREGVQIYAQTL